MYKFSVKIELQLNKGDFITLVGEKDRSRCTESYFAPLEIR